MKLKEKIENTKRLLSVAKKPSIEDLKYSAKVCATGIALIGLIGFIVYAVAILLLG